MTTHFITAEIDLLETPIKLKEAVEAKLKEQGQPLRYAITAVDPVKQVAQVEAIVTN